MQEESSLVDTPVRTGLPEHKPEKILIPPTCHERFIALNSEAAEPFRNCGIINAGISMLHEPYEIINRERICHMSVVLFSINGSGYVETDDLQAPVEAGSVLIIPPDAYHRYLAQGRWDICWFHIADDSSLTSQHENTTRLHPHPFGIHIFRAMEAYVQLSNSDGEWHAGQARRYARLVCAYLTHELYPRDTRSLLWRRQLLDEVWNQVNDHLAHHWTSKELATLAHMSTAHLHRQVQELYRKSPMEMVLHLRMQRAREYLNNTGYPLKVISELVGYANAYSFSNAFLKATGMRPRAYRRQQADE